MLDDDRSPLVEAQMMLAGLTLLQPTVAHLQALHDHHRRQMIRVIDLCDALKRTVGEME